jgi:hypothetical protein
MRFDNEWTELDLVEGAEEERNEKSAKRSVRTKNQDGAAKLNILTSL